MSRAQLLVVFCTAGAVLVGFLLVPVGMRIAVHSFVYADIAQVPHAHTALVLGASVIRGVPSPVLRERADAAVALYRQGKVERILVTGDSRERSHDEVTPVRAYLSDAGIPAKDVVLDYSGFDTYSSMYRARAVFGVDSLIIVTQDFHLPRALFIARYLGMDAYGLLAEGGTRDTKNYVREIPASAKALFDLLTRRKP